ncbi:2-methylcitrate dehydratase [Deinococcus malanensis]|uniref:2-methylcitrate dehydratase n=1 Tax=Deinococcus malanensis TaxID=1706855 RepID=A0ABQ2F3U3_9DEIO|nr:MmgE/PrpD family protein [Deinococcus malanensis]GGK39504.1 2-methylcitrate dehydratase [Deinococcus malanensis]
MSSNLPLKENRVTHAGTSATLAAFVANPPSIPTSALEDARRSVLDGLGSLLAGSVEPPARIVQDLVRDLGRADDASVFSAGRASAAGAALANGVATHILELDDIHKGSTVHAAAPIIPAALAVAEREHLGGAAFLRAVVLGYDAALRIGEAVNPSHYRHWHPTGTVATFGAAVAAGALMGLDERQMLDALGTAGTQAAGLWEFNASGAMSKTLHPGKAAMNGVMAADLARRGFTGAPTILEGPRGFFVATSAVHDARRVTTGLGEVWKVSENGYKLYSCCGHTHTAIDAALSLRQEHGWNADQVLEQVREVRVATYGPGWDIVSELNPRTPYQAKFSLAYVVSAALLEGAVGLTQFSEDRFGPSGVIQGTLARLLPRVRPAVSEELTAMYPAAWPARVEVELTNGQVLRAGGDFPRGNQENPVSTAELEAKFRALVEPRLGAVAAEHALTLVRTLEDIPDLAVASANLNALCQGVRHE